MNALQTFIQSKPYGFITDADLPALIALDRLCQVLVRCGGCRFTCAAQDVTHLGKCIKAGGDYIQDISFPVGSVERAEGWRPAAIERPAYQRAESWSINRPKSNPVPRRVCGPDFDEADCGGVFDGFGVTSDADSGL